MARDPRRPTLEPLLATPELDAVVVDFDDLEDVPPRELATGSNVLDLAELDVPRPRLVIRTDDRLGLRRG